MQRIAELQREGLWSERRLPKVQEPTRTKAHWDYLLEEMVWLAADFAQERKWKKAAAKKCARMVQKYFQEKAIQAQKAEKSQELRLKKIASLVAKEIKTFWANVEKVSKKLKCTFRNLIKQSTFHYFRTKKLFGFLFYNYITFYKNYIDLILFYPTLIKPTFLMHLYQKRVLVVGTAKSAHCVWLFGFFLNSTKVLVQDTHIELYSYVNRVNTKPRKFIWM